MRFDEADYAARSEAVKSRSDQRRNNLIALAGFLGVLLTAQGLMADKFSLSQSWVLCIINLGFVIYSGLFAKQWRDDLIQGRMGCIFLEKVYDCAWEKILSSMKGQRRLPFEMQQLVAAATYGFGILIDLLMSISWQNRGASAIDTTTAAWLLVGDAAAALLGIGICVYLLWKVNLKAFTDAVETLVKEREAAEKQQEQSQPHLWLPSMTPLILPGSPEFIAIVERLRYWKTLQGWSFGPT